MLSHSFQIPALDHSAGSPTFQIMALPRPVSAFANLVPHAPTRLPRHNLSCIVSEESVTQAPALMDFLLQLSGPWIEKEWARFPRPSGQPHLEPGLDSNLAMGSWIWHKTTVSFYFIFLQAAWLYQSWTWARKQHVKCISPVSIARPGPARDMAICSQRGFHYCRSIWPPSMCQREQTACSYHSAFSA